MRNDNGKAGQPGWDVIAIVAAIVFFVIVVIISPRYLEALTEMTTALAAFVVIRKELRS